MSESRDVVVIGGAVIGSAVAYYLTANPDFAGSVLVIERDPTYAARAQARCQSVEPLPSPSIAPFVTAREAPRVPFNALIERGLMKAGAKLTDAKGRVNALVRADGTIALKKGKDQSVGSIHRIGAIAQGLEACNGWTYWHYEDKSGRQPIDSLRHRFIQLLSAFGWNHFTRGAYE